MMEEDNIKEFLLPFKSGMSLHVSQSHVEGGLKIVRWRKEMMKVLVRGGCPNIGGDGWLEEFHLRVDCRNSKEMEPIIRAQLLAFSCLMIVGIASVIIYALHWFTSKNKQQMASLSGPRLNSMPPCKDEKMHRLDESSRCCHVVSCDVPRDHTSHGEAIFVVSTREFETQHRMMKEGMRDGKMMNEMKKDIHVDCSGCFPVLKFSNDEMRSNEMRSHVISQPDVLHRRIKLSSPGINSSDQSITTSTLVSQKSLFTSLFIIFIIASSSSSSSPSLPSSSSSSSSSDHHSDGTSAQIFIFLPERISPDDINIYLNGALINMDETDFGLHSVNEPITFVHPVFSSRDSGLDDVMEGRMTWMRKETFQPECPEGFYSQRQNDSLICTECKQCGDMSYELSPCTSGEDGVCFPDPLLDESFTIDKNEDEDNDRGIIIDTSRNVFYEDLLNTRNLETTYYVTDTTQASDFYWDRESGLRVNIGIHNVHLLPGYKDADHEKESDNKFMSQNPDIVANQSFQAVRKSFCRFPVPDYYNLNLDVTPNRTSTSESIDCAQDNDFCLKGQFRRTLNSPCPESMTHLAHQQQHPNSVVCVVESQLLSHVFKLRSGPDLPFGHNAKKCLLAHKKCSFCLESPKCRATLDKVEKQCCKSECLSSADCKFYYSNTCTHLSTLCATGPTYRYTIEPVYRSLENEFRCHLVHATQPILYELFVFVQIPSMNFQTKKIMEKIPAKDFQFNVRGKFQVYFLTIEHSSELKMAEELMLAGRKGHQRRVEFVVYPARINLTNVPDYTVRYIKSNVWGTSMIPVEPFLYSTSTWNKEASANCSKDINNMASLSSVPRIYHDASDMFSLNESSFSRVNVLIQNLGSHFSYHIKHSTSPPFFRFIVPANSSILSYYSHEFPGYLLRESLTACIQKLEHHWNVSLNGKTSSCPAFFEIVLYEGTLILPTIAKLDVLVLCPPKFNVTFKVPHSVQERSTTSFHLQIKDSKKNLNFFLTHVERKEFISHTSVITTIDSDISSDDLEFSHILIWLVLTTGVVLTTSSFLCYVITLERSHFNDKYFSQHKKPKMTTCHICHPSNLYTNHHSCRATPGFAEFLLLKTLYGVLFNFTAFFLAVHFLVLYDSKELSKSVSEDNIKLKSVLDKLIKIDDHHLHDDVKMYGNILACSRSATKQLRKAIDDFFHLKHLWSVDRMALFSIYTHNLINRRFNNFNESLIRHAHLQLEMVSNIFHSNIQDYFLFLHEKLFMNEWFVSASKFFNLSTTFNCHVRMNNVLIRSSPKNAKYEKDFCFYQFVQLEDVDLTKPWLNNMKNRLLITSPLVIIKQFTATKFSNNKIKIFNHLEYLNSIKFVVAQPKTKSQIRGITKQTIFDDDLLVKNNYEKIIIEDFLESPINTKHIARSLLYVTETFDKMFLVQSAWIFCAVIDILIFIYRINHSFANALIHDGGREYDLSSPFSSSHHLLRNRRSHNYCYWTFTNKLDMLSHENLKPCQTHSYISFAATNVDVAKIENQPFLSGNNHTGFVSVRVVFLVASSSLRNQEVSKIFLSVGLIVLLSCTFRIFNEVLADTKLLSIQRFICDLPQINFTFNDDSYVFDYLRHLEKVLEIDFSNVQNFVDFFQSSSDNLKLLFESSRPYSSQVFMKRFHLVPCSISGLNMKQYGSFNMECTDNDKSIREFNILFRRIELFTSTFALLWMVGHFLFKTFLCRLRSSIGAMQSHQHQPTSNLQTFNKSKDLQKSPQTLFYGTNEVCSGGASLLVKERIYTETKV